MLRPNSEVYYTMFGGMVLPVVQMEMGTADFSECEQSQTPWSEGAAQTGTRWIENTPEQPGQSPSSRAAPWGGGAQLLSSEYPRTAAAWSEGSLPTASAFTEGSIPGATAFTELSKTADAWTEQGKTADNWTEQTKTADAWVETEGTPPWPPV